MTIPPLPPSFSIFVPADGKRRTGPRVAPGAGSSRRQVDKASGPLSRGSSARASKTGVRAPREAGWHELRALARSDPHDAREAESRGAPCAFATGAEPRGAEPGRPSGQSVQSSSGDLWLQKQEGPIMNAQPDLASELETWLELDRPEALAARASELHPADLAAALTQLEAEGQTALLERLPSEIAASILAELDPLACRHVVCDLGEPSLSILLEEMSPQAAVSMLEPLPVEARERVIAALSPSMRSEVEQRLLHPEDSAGRIMTTEVPSVAWEGNVAQATESLRRRFGDRSAIDTIFVIDDAERLQGRVSPLRLLLADPDQPLQELVDREVLS